jgi:hypothetical protein
MVWYSLVALLLKPSYMETDSELISFLMENSGPILRWRTAMELAPDNLEIDREALYADLLACAEVRRWFSLLGEGPVHHSMDSSAENVLAKLGEYGLRAGLPELDERVLPYYAIGEGQPHHDEAIILVPFLVRLGYHDIPQVVNWLDVRIEMLYKLAASMDYDLYMSEAERQCLPPSQRELNGNPKLFYKLQFNNHWSELGLPTCYDLYALSYLPKDDPFLQKKVESTIIYLLKPDFQDTPGGYIWNRVLHRPFAAGRVFLACLPTDREPQKLVLFMEMLAQFKSGRASDWFLHGMAHLESFRTRMGTYIFPRNYLSEKSGYSLYAGMHMGLGEWPRDSHALELESTFRMLRLQKLNY